MAKVDISAEVLTSISAILSQYAPGRPVYLFGSRVTGLAQSDSDLDLAIGGEPVMDWKQLSTIRCAIEDSDVPYAVDVLDLHEAKGIFRKRIEMEWVPLADVQPELDRGGTCMSNQSQLSAAYKKDALFQEGGAL